MMKRVVFVVFLLFALHTSQATLDVIDKIKRNAANNFHVLSEELAKNIIDFSHKAKEQIKTIKAQAKNKLKELTQKSPIANLLSYQELVPTIDIDKVKDFYTPKLSQKVQNIRNNNAVKNTVYGPNTLVEKSVEKTPALDSLRLKKDYLRSIFEGKYPYPVVTRQVVYIYD